MSTSNKNTNIPDTLRTFETNTNAYKNTTSIFATPADFSMSKTDIIDNDSWYEELGINLFPLHRIADFKEEGAKNTLKESQQDFLLKTGKGKYNHRFSFDWSLDYHVLLNELSGQKLNFFYISNRVIRGVEKADGTIKGFESSLVDIEPILFASGGNSGTSEMFIQLLDSNELNESGYEVEVDWEPAKLDRLALNIDLSFGEDSITMFIKHLSNTITGIKASDITITDVVNGDITFSTYVPGDGIYLLSGFSDTITTACLYIQSTIYIGYKKFSFNYVVTVVNNMVLEDDNNMVTEYGNNMILEI